MKKVLVFAMLFFAGRDGFAQSGSLELKNASPCSVYVNVMADETTWLPMACSIISCTINMPGGTTRIFNTPGDFLIFLRDSCGAPPAIPPAYWTSLTDWYYTDVSFQYECATPMPNGGGYMSESALSGGTCETAPTSWASAPHTADWYSTLGGTGLPMSNIEVVFH